VVTHGVVMTSEGLTCVWWVPGTIPSPSCHWEKRQQCA